MHQLCLTPGKWQDSLTQPGRGNPSCWDRGSVPHPLALLQLRGISRTRIRAGAGSGRVLPGSGSCSSHSPLPEATLKRLDPCTELSNGLISVLKRESVLEMVLHTRDLAPQQHHVLSLCDVRDASALRRVPRAGRAPLAPTSQPTPGTQGAGTPGMLLPEPGWIPNPSLAGPQGAHCLSPGQRNDPVGAPRAPWPSSRAGQSCWGRAPHHCLNVILFQISASYSVFQLQGQT